MPTRRAVAGSLALMALPACTRPAPAYADVARETWRLPPAGGTGLPVRALTHAASLAANGHNTQPWRFSVMGGEIAIRPDFGRRTPVVDPDDHHLFASLGCAAETLLQAARGYGWAGEARFVGGDEGLRVNLQPAAAAAGPLFHAIARRASTRAEYDGSPVAAPILKSLAASVGPQVDLAMITDQRRLNRLTELIVEGNAAQLRRPAFVRELKDWIRFSEADAVARRDGLFAGASGNPTLPRWLGEPLFDLAFTERGETDKIVRQMRSSAGAAVFLARTNDPAGWVEAGRAFTRFALQATASGLKLAFLNQPVEEVPTRGELATWLGAAGRRPNLVVRFGRGLDMPRALRRPVEQVLSGAVVEARSSRARRVVTPTQIRNCPK